MRWLIPKDEPGISHGGQFYQNQNGVVELPDHVDISIHGYQRAPDQVQEPEKSEKTKK